MAKRAIQLWVSALIPLFLTSGHAMAGSTPPPLPKEQHTIILVDRSGSMTAIRKDGVSRFQAAITDAKSYVNLPLSVPHFFSVWTFEEETYVKEQGFADAATTLSTLGRLKVGNGVTPLALTVCDAIDHLFTFKTELENQAKKVVKLVSDGEENSTPRTTQCYGPNSSVTKPPFTTNSWQWKVYNKFATRNANTPPNAGNFQAVLDVTVLSGYVSLMDARPSFVEVSGSGAAVTPTSASKTAAYLDFLQTLAGDSGGSYSAIVDTQPAPVVGDANSDYCVDSVDYYLVLENYGFTVPPANPAADLNRDKVVDYLDYTIVMNNQGKGSRCGSSTLLINK
ncbi:hypothetical protein [Melittangium boletus]|uniref:hypothetical protein n=1 Tax=Melittangium boletus TaxID=83453 RepID=UPI003DA2A614